MVRPLESTTKSVKILEVYMSVMYTLSVYIIKINMLTDSPLTQEAKSECHQLFST